jgi:DNA-binding transcriptional ArsR family regulator
MANDAFAALAHPIRREIVERLSGGPASVGEVTRDFGVSKPTLSRHLKMLEDAGVVSRAIDGRTHRLAL